MDNSKLEELAQKELDRQQGFKYRIFGCSSTACISAGARSTIDTMQLAVKACECNQGEVEVINTGCMGLCSRRPSDHRTTPALQPFSRSGRGNQQQRRSRRTRRNQERFDKSFQPKRSG